MESKTLFLLSHELLILVTYFGLVQDCLAMRPLHFTSLNNRNVFDTGGCPQVYVDSEVACAIQCYSQTWCRVYVLGPCNQGLPNPCLCVICQMDPVVQVFVNGDRTVGTLSTPKRLVDTNSCGSGLQWTMVHSSCIDSVGSISSTFTVSPILALEFTKMAMVIGRTSYYASPVCPPTFTPRGEIVCHSTNGVWNNQNTLACFSTECYQQYGTKRYYAGFKNVSRSGRPCWYWRYDGPFRNNMLGHPFPFDYYDIIKAKNYCRCFFTEDYGNPHCYNANYNSVTDPVRWEDCELAECFNVY